MQLFIFVLLIIDKIPVLFFKRMIIDKCDLYLYFNHKIILALLLFL
jgi:hypothetical protein